MQATHGDLVALGVSAFHARVIVDEARLLRDAYTSAL